MSFCLEAPFICDLKWLEEFGREEPMIIILRGNVTLLSCNSCVNEFFNWLVREKYSLLWKLLRQNDEAFMHAVEQLSVLFTL